MVLRDLLINYAPAGGEGGFLLLKARGAADPRLALLREGTVAPGERIDLSRLGGKNLWLEVELRPSLSGRLRELLYRPGTVRLAAWREPGQGSLGRGRAPAPMLAAGFVASPLLRGNGDVLDFFAGKPVARPAAYSVELLPGEERFWRRTVRFRLYEIANLAVSPRGEGAPSS
jgi:hypothetical protein